MSINLENYDQLRMCFVKNIYSLFLSNDKEFLTTSMCVDEELSNINVGYRVAVVLKDLIIVLSITNLNRELEIKFCFRNRKISTDFNIIKHSVSTKDLYDIENKVYSNLVSDGLNYITMVLDAFKYDIDENGIEVFLTKLQNNIQLSRPSVQASNR